MDLVRRMLWAKAMAALGFLRGGERSGRGGERSGRGEREGGLGEREREMSERLERRRVCFLFFFIFFNLI